MKYNFQKILKGIKIFPQYICIMYSKGWKKMRQIIAMGGGGFTMEPNQLLDQYILNQSDKATPKICFVPTASGDQVDYVKSFYQAFKKMNCKPTHLSFFEANFENLEDFILQQDIIYVGGGSTRNMLLIWENWGFDEILKKAYEKGIILAGLSAGSNSWFEEAVTDPLNAPLYKLDCLGLLKGSFCPHYSEEVKRRPSYHQMILKGEIQAGYGVDDSAALHFIDDSLSKVISSNISSKAYFVEIENSVIIEKPFEPIFLGNDELNLD
jgi:peptidase E